MRNESAVPFPALCIALLSISGGALVFTGCSATDTPLSATAVNAETSGLNAGQSADRCVNVQAEGTAALGLVMLPNGTTGFGGSWTPISLGGISGQMASVVLNQHGSGQSQDGAQHLMLQHAFQTPAGDYFLTEDRAVCAPAGPSPATCRVNDVLTIVGGTGIFANATGSLRNHGVIDFGQGMLDFSMRGRVCGDGL